MGVVYKAVDTRLKRPVALKAIHAHHLEQRGAGRQLKKEALAAASLDHPYICKIYEFIEHDGQPLLAMEYVEGETLARRLKAGPMPVDDALRYGAEIADALVEAHAKRVVHRDIKPSNIVITAHDHVKVLDFGIARMPAGLDDTTVTTIAEGVAAGTPRYMAPEQVEGGGCDARADIFSQTDVECLQRSCREFPHQVNHRT